MVLDACFEVLKLEEPWGVTSASFVRGHVATILKN